MGCYHTKDTAEFHFPSREEAKCQNNNTAALDFMFKRTSDTNEQKQKKNNEDSFSSIQKPTLLEEIKIKGMSGSKITFHKDNKTINSNVDASSFKRSIEIGRSNLYK